VLKGALGAASAAVEAATKTVAISVNRRCFMVSGPFKMCFKDRTNFAVVHT